MPEPPAGRGSPRDNLRRVQERIERARERRGGGAEVTLVAVTKGRRVEAVRELLAAGVADVGENRVQEARAKWPALAGDFERGRVRRHMVGHLQRNKAAAAPELFDVVQSVDSLRLARKISEAAVASGARLTVLLQVNEAREAAKSGFAPAELDEAAPQVASLPGLELAGLMTMAPAEAGEARLREVFGRLRARRDALQAALPGRPLRHLSMGMSSDFEVAVEEGATMVRIGSALFDEA